MATRSQRQQKPGRPPRQTTPPSRGNGRADERKNGAEARLEVRLCRPGSDQCESLPPARISDILPDPGVVLWVDLRDPGPEELEVLREEFGFHRLALEDVARQRQRPKVDEYPGYYFVVMYAPLEAGETLSLQASEVDLFVGRNYVVTAHRGEVPALADAIHRWENTDAELRTDVGLLVHTIVDTIVDQYFPIVDRIEDRLDDIELGLFAARTRFDAEELLAVKRSLYTLRKVVYPLREVFNVFLRREQALFKAETYPYFQDVYDHVLRLLDTIDIQRDMATGALEAQLSIVSNRLNETMKQLTVVAICVAILGAVFGAWGMNFDEVPLHHLKQLGFYVVSGGTLVFLAIALLITKWRGLW